MDGRGFSVKSLYNSFQTKKCEKIYKVLWKMKLPFKIKIFLWLVLWMRILTKDNPLKRGWSGDHHCMFCAGDESIDHLFFGCPLLRFVWGVFQVAFDLIPAPSSLAEVGGGSNSSRVVMWLWPESSWLQSFGLHGKPGTEHVLTLFYLMILLS